MFRELEEEFSPLESAKKAVYKFMDKREKELEKNGGDLKDYVIVIEKKYWDVFMGEKDFRNGLVGNIADYGGFRVKEGKRFDTIFSLKNYEDL
jgi:hypothetical protein